MLWQSRFVRMGQIGRVVLIRNAVETLGYFSEQIASELRCLGYETYFIDYEDLYVCVQGAERFVQRGDAALVTFNFIGLSGEEIFMGEDGRSLWDRYNVRVYCLLADHPMYYHRQLLGAFENLKVFCVDRGHVSYMHRFYPGVQVGFLPLGGNACGRDWESATESARERAVESVPYSMRRYDVVFTANYVPPGMFEGKLTELGAEYEAFYRGILDDLLSDPGQTMDAVMERHLKEELGTVPEEELAEALYGMRWLDLYARTLLRGGLVRELVDEDVPVRVFGAGWEELECKKRQNLIRESGQVDSAACVEAMRQARIALNVLPWFRDGAHDRIFTAMQQGALALTDAAPYLREEFSDGKELVFFSLQRKEELPRLVRTLQEDQEWAALIAACGHKKAFRHTWAERARALARELEKDQI